MENDFAKLFQFARNKAKVYEFNGLFMRKWGFECIEL